MSQLVTWKTARLASVILALGSAGGTARAQVHWTYAKPVVIQSMSYVAMAYDSARARMVLLGANQTWEWDGASWQQRSPTTRPTARNGHAMAYDERRGVIVMFGGSSPGYVPDTWEYDGTTWTQRFPAAAPSGRRDHAMAYDAARGTIVLFGGTTSPGQNELGDTWEYDGTNWTQRFPAQSPPARHDTAMAYDTARGRMVLFGGSVSPGLNELGDTWEWDGVNWTEKTTPTLPPARSHTEMAYDSARGRMVIFGGKVGSSTNDCWEYDGTDWIERPTANPPPARSVHVLEYDAARQEVLVFGGSGPGGLLGDTWTWNGVSWTERAPANVPDYRDRHAMAYDERRQETLLFGGHQPAGMLGDTWLWDGERWREAASTTAPPARASHALAYDSAREVVVLFGGGTTQGVAADLGDTWEWDGAAWTQRFPSVSPHVRERHAMTYDSARRRVVLFGGYSSATTMIGDTWEWDGTDWVERTPPIQPDARAEHTMAYDAARGVVVLHGGLDGTSTPRGDTWEWDGTDWSQRTANGNTPSLHGGATVYDSARQRTVTFAGRAFHANSRTTQEVWEWDGQEWRYRGWLDPQPEARMFHGLAYDKARREVVTFGGSGNWGFPVTQETWRYAPVTPATYTSYGVGCTGTAGAPSLAPIGEQLPWIGGDFEFALSNLVPGQPAWVFVGASSVQWGAVPLPLPLGGLGPAGCAVYASGEIVLPVVNNNGIAHGSLSVPASPALLGRAVYLQGIALDPAAGGLTVSDAGAVVFGGR